MTIGPEQALSYGAEIVIVATGSSMGRRRPERRHLRAAARAPTRASLGVLTPEQIMVEGKRPAGRRVVVYDCEGYFMGAGLAELLRTEGHDVVLATPYEQVAPDLSRDPRGLPPAPAAARDRRGDADRGLAQLTRTRRRRGLRAVRRAASPGADAVVLVTQRISQDSLYRELAASRPRCSSRPGSKAVYRAGDCVAPRVLGDAIFDGHRLAREIDGAAPGRAAPLPARATARRGAAGPSPSLLRRGR